ncbi:MAG: amidase [Dehalococcoidia bacterium]|nr:amidase [Dehalococcoidia bacterium]
MNVWLDDACSLADAIRRGHLSARDALEASLEAIHVSKLNTIVTLDAVGARRGAEAIDQKVKRGEDPGPFAGVPMLVKDMEDAAALPTSYGSIVFKDNIAADDCTHVQRLRGAGAVVVGKAATSEFGFVAYTSTKLHGVTCNPWNLERTPGGSSGGSAAAVAGGLVPIATGGDGGGSIRIPASHTGLVGMKGTYGRIPRGPRTEYGMLAAVKGALCRSVRDAARWYDVTAGYDQRDPLSLPRREEGWEANLGKTDLRGLRVAVAPNLGNAVVHPEVERVVTAAADVLVEAAGLQRVDIDVKVPENGLAWARSGLPSLLADLGDYWPNCKDDLTMEIHFAMQASPQYRAWHGAEVEKFRIEMNEAMADLFEQVDIVLCAASPMEPFAAEGPMPYSVGEVPVSPYNAGALTIPANLSGFPAVSIPAGVSGSGLPVGLQAYARRHEDALLLDLAMVMERAKPWPLVAPAAPC